MAGHGGGTTKDERECQTAPTPTLAEFDWSYPLTASSSPNLQWLQGWLVLDGEHGTWRENRIMENQRMEKWVSYGDTKNRVWLT